MELKTRLVLLFLGKILRNVLYLLQISCTEQIFFLLVKFYFLDFFRYFVMFLSLKLLKIQGQKCHKVNQKVQKMKIQYPYKEKICSVHESNICAILIDYLPFIFQFLCNGNTVVSVTYQLEVRLNSTLYDKAFYKLVWDQHNQMRVDLHTLLF